MENQYQKWVNLSYLAVAALVGFIFFTLAHKIIGAYDLEARVSNIDVMVRVLSVVIGAVLFFILFRHEQAYQFMNEVVAELDKVTWPTQKDTTSATFIVIVMVLISGAVLGLLDYIWTMLIKAVL